MCMVAKAYVHIPLWNGYFKIRGTKEDPITYVIKMELTYIHFECGIIDPDVNRFLNEPG